MEKLEKLERQLLIVEDEQKVQDVYRRAFDYLIGRSNYMLVDNGHVGKWLEEIFDSLICDGEFYESIKKKGRSCGMGFVEIFAQKRMRNHPEKYSEAKKYEGIWFVSGDRQKVEIMHSRGICSYLKPVSLPFCKEVAHYMRTGELVRHRTSAAI